MVSPPEKTEEKKKSLGKFHFDIKKKKRKKEIIHISVLKQYFGTRSS